MMEIEIEEIGDVSQKSVRDTIKKFDSSSYKGLFFAAWGIVTGPASSERNTVNVKMNNGMELREVRVRSEEWAGANSSRGFGEKDMPPKDCKVLVIFPDGIIENALVLCSVLELVGSVNQKQTEELLIAGKDRERVRVTEAGWKETYNKDTGDTKFEKEDAGIVISVKGDGSETKIQDANNTFVMGTTGISMNENLLVKV